MAITMEVWYSSDHMDRGWEIGEVKSKHSYCNNPTNNMKGAALHAECQAIAWKKSKDKRVDNSILLVTPC